MIGYVISVLERASLPYCDKRINHRTPTIQQHAVHYAP